MSAAPRWVPVALALALACGGPTTAALPPRGPDEVRLVPSFGLIGRDPAWVVAQDGDGPWMRLTASAGVYRFAATSGRYTIAAACPSGKLGSVTHATTAEITELRDYCADDRAIPTFRRTGAIRGAPPGAKPKVTFGLPELGAIGAKIADDGLSYTVDLPAATYDVVANDGGATPRVLLLSAVDISGAGTTDIDFSSGTRTTVSRPITVTGLLPSQQLQMAVGFFSKGGGSAQFTGQTAVSMLAPATLMPGESQRLTAVAHERLALNDSRMVMLGLTGEPPSTIELPPPLVVKTVGAGPAGAIFRPQVEVAPYPEALHYSVSVGSTRNDAGLTWFVRFTKNWLGERTTLPFPDLTAAPGFDPAWGPVRNRPFSVTTTAVTGDMFILDQLFPARPTEQPWTVRSAGVSAMIDAPP